MISVRWPAYSKRTPFDGLKLVFASLRAGVGVSQQALHRARGIPHLLRSARNKGRDRTTFIVNGLTGSPRSARPVRIALHTPLGADIDGAWWPHTSSVAAELPALIDALHRPLGEIVDITINWSSSECAPDLNSMCYGAMVIPGRAAKPQRLMVVSGSRAKATLLVVPHMTATPLGWMVLRRAAHIPMPVAERDSTVFRTADNVVRAAQAESASWTSRVPI